jgi:hypothetical protein
MLTDMSPSAGQFYGTQIPAMGMNITNITNISSHIQKPNVSFIIKLSDFIISTIILMILSIFKQFGYTVKVVKLLALRLE